MCRGDGTDAIQLVQTLPQGTGTNGIEAKHEGTATPHREMDSRQVLHRSGNVVTWLATFFASLSFVILHYLYEPALSGKRRSFVSYLCLCI